MKKVSIFNEVIGPIMRGPSSSHTAASFHLGKIIRNILEDDPFEVNIYFAKGSSYAEVYRQQGSDLGFATGILGKEITSNDFNEALSLAEEEGVKIQFRLKDFVEPVHPNTIEVKGISRGGLKIKAIGKSIGGGAIHISEMNGWPVDIYGDSFEVIVEVNEKTSEKVHDLLKKREGNIGDSEIVKGINRLIIYKNGKEFNNSILKKVRQINGVNRLWTIKPVFYTTIGNTIFSDSAEMISFAKKNNLSLGQTALIYESKLLGMSEKSALKEMYRRYQIMKSSVETGLSLGSGMQLLKPTAKNIWKKASEGKLAIGGIHTKAATRALAVMHVNSSMGVVCASPTGGAAGTLPGVITTLVEEKKLNEKDTSLALFAASAIGLILAIKGTFAAEVAGCQVEIGAAGAMASAAVVEAVGGSALQACDSAAISFQNTMGSVCDLVQGIVEIPCHTRNAVAASSAFVCADMIMGGYLNPISLDETIDAVMSVGKMLPSELRCTALGGIAMTPSALSLKNLKHEQP